MSSPPERSSSEVALGRTSSEIASAPASSEIASAPNGSEVASAGTSSDTLTPAPRRGRGRRPSNQVRAEILQAAGRLLLSEGMAAFTIERVAALAGASKMTIYKWWSSKGVLALEAYAASVDASLAVPETGDITADLTANLLTFTRLLRDSPAGRVFAELIGAAQTDPDLAAALAQNYTRPRRAVGSAALRAAQERGQIRADADLEALTDQLWGAILYRLMMGNDPLSDDFVHALVSNAMAGVRPADDVPARTRARSRR